MGNKEIMMANFLRSINYGIIRFPTMFFIAMIVAVIGFFTLMIYNEVNDDVPLENVRCTTIGLHAGAQGVVLKITCGDETKHISEGSVVLAYIEHKPPALNCTKMKAGNVRCEVPK